MKLTLALACDEAVVRPDGKLDLRGIFNELWAADFPAAQERMTVVFVVEWSREERGRKPLRADLVDDAGGKVLTIQGHTDVEPRAEARAPAQTRLVMPLENVVFPRAGRYTFELELGGERVEGFSLHVGQDASAGE